MCLQFKDTCPGIHVFGYSRLTHVIQSKFRPNLSIGFLECLCKILVMGPHGLVDLRVKCSEGTSGNSL